MRTLGTFILGQYIFFVAFIGGSSASGSGINGIFVALMVVVEEGGGLM